MGITVYLDESLQYSPSGGISEAGYLLKSMQQLWQPVRLMVMHVDGWSLLASATCYGCIFIFHLGNPETKGLKIWPKVMLAARRFLWATSHGNCCIAFRDFCLERFLFNLLSSAYSALILKGRNLFVAVTKAPSPQGGKHAKWEQMANKGSSDIEVIKC